MDKPVIKVGLGVMIYKNGRVLLGKRKGSHGAGEYASPGGSMEFGESINKAAKREVLEETGIRIKNIKFLFFANLRKYPGKHWLHIQLRADWLSGTPEVKEPQKCESWDWYSPKKIPKPMFKTYKYLKIYQKTKQIYFDD